MRTFLPARLARGVRSRLARSARALAERLEPDASQSAAAEAETIAALEARFPNAPRHWLEAVAQHAPGWGLEDAPPRPIATRHPGHRPAPASLWPQAPAGEPARNTQSRGSGAAEPRSRPRLAFATSRSNPQDRADAPAMPTHDGGTRRQEFAPVSVLHRQPKHNLSAFSDVTSLMPQAPESPGAPEHDARSLPPARLKGKSAFAEAFAWPEPGAHPRFWEDTGRTGAAPPIWLDAARPRNNPTAVPHPSISAPIHDAAPPIPSRPQYAAHEQPTALTSASTTSPHAPLREPTVSARAAQQGQAAAPLALPPTALGSAPSAHIEQVRTPSPARDDPFSEPPPSRVPPEPRSGDPALHPSATKTPGRLDRPVWSEVHSSLPTLGSPFPADMGAHAWPSLPEGEVYEHADRHADMARLTALSAAQEAL